MGAVLYLMAGWYTERASGQLSARIGSQVGKITSVLDQNLLKGDPRFVRQLLNTMMSDPAILCVDVNQSEQTIIDFSQPRRLGCKVITPEKMISVPVPKADGFNVAVGFSEEEVRKAQEQAIIVAMIITGVAALCAMVLSIAAFRFSVGTSISTLLNTMGKVETGNFVPIEVTSRDEMGDLCNAFNSMTDRLQTRDREIQAALANAKSADRAKSEFLANMSHEIRTPMNGVMGMAELLSGTKLNSKQKMFTDVIVKSGASLLTIINDILDFSKLDAGQMELDPVPFSLSDAIEDIATLISTKVTEKELELIIRIEPTLPSMFVGDVGRIRQIVTNLIGNAVKFTEMGHVYVNVTAFDCEEGERQGLCISIEDTGVGIPGDKLATVFQQFSQVDTSATRKYEGTGLGLSICRSLVNLMNGQMGVESKLGEGSTFWFKITLPVHENEETSKAPVDVQGSRVLIVDDNEVNRLILTEQMECWGFDNAAVASGIEAIRLLHAIEENGLSTDCIILDYQMPEMDGGDVVAALKADPRLCNIPVLLLTSVDQTSEGKIISSLGIEGSLTKPARAPMLLQLLVEILQNKKRVQLQGFSDISSELKSVA